MLTRHSDTSDEQRFELQAARDNDKRMLGVKVYEDDPVPPELEGAPVMDWTWEGIVDWIDSIPDE